MLYIAPDKLEPVIYIQLSSNVLGESPVSRFV